MAAALRSHQSSQSRLARHGAPADTWTSTTPTLRSARVTLRALMPGDAASLFSFLTTEPVGQFILPPPDSVERFGRFIEWTHRQQASGRHLCFGIVPEGHDVAVGLVQVRRETADAHTAEWGFVLNERFWGTGLFVACSELVLTYLFEIAGVHRLEARTIVANGRATGALTKLGAVKEGILRHGFCRQGEYLDQILWSILASDWPARPASARTTLLY